MADRKGMCSPGLARFRHRIHEKAANCWAPPVLIVAFGDSVTQGATANDEYAHSEVYHARLQRRLEHLNPLSTFSTINAGVSGQTAPGALALLERDVIRHQPDLTLIAFGLNDAWNGRDGVTGFAEALRDLVDQVRSRTESDIILFTPNFMNTRVPPGAAPDADAGLRQSAVLQNSGVLAAYAQAIRNLARDADVACADVYRAWEDLAAAGVDTDSMLANGMNHPNAASHAIASELAIRCIAADPGAMHPPSE